VSLKRPLAFAELSWGIKHLIAGGEDQVGVRAPAKGRQKKVVCGKMLFGENGFLKERKSHSCKEGKSGKLWRTGGSKRSRAQLRSLKRKREISSAKVREKRKKRKKRKRDRALKVQAIGGRE